MKIDWDYNASDGLSFREKIMHEVVERLAKQKEARVGSHAGRS